MKILVVVDSVNIEDSSGSKANVALIHNLAEAGYDVLVYHYTLVNIQLSGVRCVAISEIKYSPLYFLSRMQRILQRNLNFNFAQLLQKFFGFSFTFFNDTRSIAKALEKSDFAPDLVLTLSKGASFRPHYAILKSTRFHHKWMAYVHDPYPFHFYPKPYAWIESGSRFKEKFFMQVSEKAKYSAFPSQLLLEWMSGFYPNFEKTGVLIPHQNRKKEFSLPIKSLSFPSYFDPSKFNLLHAGNLMAQRSPEGLIEGFQLFLKKNSAAQNDSQLLLLGPAQDHVELLSKHKNNSPEIYIHNGNIDFETVYHLQKNASVNIILEAKSEISPFLPGKFPHCVDANTIILSLAPYHSETRRLLGNDYPYWSEIDDEEKIAVLIEKLYLLWKQNKDNLILNRADLEDYLSVNYLKKVFNELPTNL